MVVNNPDFYHLSIDVTLLFNCLTVYLIGITHVEHQASYVVL